MSNMEIQKRRNRKKRNRKKNKELPLVSVCTPTFNRRPFIPTMIRCFLAQTYPKERMEWIIADDGSDPIGDLVENVECVRYYRIDKKITIGEKRNFMHCRCNGEIVVYMDDDDYYPSMRVSHAVDMLTKNPRYLIAGSSEMHMYSAKFAKMYQLGPYWDNHATAATFAFRRELVMTGKGKTTTAYSDTSVFAEEKSFLQNYKIPLLQLDSKKTIMVIAHSQNSLDKNHLVKTSVVSRVKPSPHSMDVFVDDPDAIKFYQSEMEIALKRYNLGSITLKPRLVKTLLDTHFLKIRNYRSEIDKMQKMIFTMTNLLDLEVKRIEDIFVEMTMNREEDLGASTGTSLLAVDASLNREGADS